MIDINKAREQYLQRLRDGQCVRCGAAFLGGAPPHQLTVSDEMGERVELWCEDCIEDYSSACWNYEEWGPYPAKIRPRQRPGNLEG